MDEQAIRVLIADDQELVRSGYRAILGIYPDIEVIGAAKDGAEAVALAQQLRPDVVLMDVRMPVMDGIAAARDIASNPTLAGTHVLVLTTFDMDQYVYDAIRAGASGFLLKDADPDDIAEAVRVVARGDALIQPSVMKRLMHDMAAGAAGALAPAAELRERVAALTGREREILVLVARGLTNDQIGEQLFISPATVKTHVARIMAKTASHDRAQLVMLAYEAGLVSPGVA